jgi:SAM-dependent methyltransferase
MKYDPDYIERREDKLMLINDVEFLQNSPHFRDVPLSTTSNHENQRNFLCDVGNKKGMRILEIGSREVTGKSQLRSLLQNATYIGFDYYPGNNVDIVGDAHKLSSYFDKTEKVDVIFSSACFEHFAMPWIVAKEMAKILKVGGYVIIETHFSYLSHERPWHFFQFSDMALKVLFSSALGFECIDAGMCNPMIARFSSLAAKYLQDYPPLGGFFCHSDYIGKKVKDVVSFDWDTIDLAHVVGDSKYPTPGE